MAWDSPWHVMPLTFLNSACAILDPIMEIQVLNYRICTFIHLAINPSLLTAEIISLFLTAGHDIQEYPKTLSWQLQDFTSYRLKVTNSLGFTDYYTHPGEVSECQRRASSSCLVFKVLQEFPALPQGAPLLLLNIPSGFPFVFLPGSEARGWRGGRGGSVRSLMFITTGEHRAARAATQDLPIQTWSQRPECSWKTTPPK